MEARRDQDGRPEEEKHVAEVTHLISRAGKCGAAGSLDRPPREALASRPETSPPSEKKTGWRYSIICTNIPITAIPLPVKPVETSGGLIYPCGFL